MVLVRFAPGWTAATISARRHTGSPPLPVTSPGTPRGPAHMRSGPSGLTGTQRYARPHVAGCEEHLIWEALRIRRLGVRIPSGAQDHKAPDLRILGSGADLFPSLLDGLVLLRARPSRNPWSRPVRGSTGPCTPVPILCHPASDRIRRTAGQLTADRLTPSRPTGRRQAPPPYGPDWRPFGRSRPVTGQR
jgi:hypothetical protein